METETASSVLALTNTYGVPLVLAVFMGLALVFLVRHYLKESKAREDKLMAESKAREDKLMAEAKEREDRLLQEAREREDRLIAEARERDAKFMECNKASSDSLNRVAGLIETGTTVNKGLLETNRKLTDEINGRLHTIDTNVTRILDAVNK